MAAHQSKKLRRSAEDLLRRTGMTASPGGAEWMQMQMPAMAGGAGAGPMAQPFAHHAAGQGRGQWSGSRMAAAHDLVPGHRHRGAEQHSALSGR